MNAVCVLCHIPCDFHWFPLFSNRSISFGAINIIMASWFLLRLRIRRGSLLILGLRSRLILPDACEFFLVVHTQIFLQRILRRDFFIIKVGTLLTIGPGSNVSFSFGQNYDGFCFTEVLFCLNMKTIWNNTKKCIQNDLYIKSPSFLSYLKVAAIGFTAWQIIEEGLEYKKSQRTHAVRLHFMQVTMYGQFNNDNCIGIENDLYIYHALQLMNKLWSRDNSHIHLSVNLSHLHIKRNTCI